MDNVAQVVDAKAEPERSSSSPTATSTSWRGWLARTVAVAALAALAQQRLSSDPNSGTSPAAAGAAALAAAVKTPVAFSVHYNGDGRSAGIATSTDAWPSLNALIRTLCEELPEVSELAGHDNATLRDLCEPDLGARALTHTGSRLRTLADVGANGTRVYLVPRGKHFMYPLSHVGAEVYPTGVPSPVPSRPIRLVQLSESPRVFSIENLVTDEEVTAILDHNAGLVKPSEVGFAGWRDGTRTSSTAWDFNSWASKNVRRRSFELLGMDFDEELADAVQVLRYNISEWYKPHMDSFDDKAYDGHDPTVNNGTNRFATVFLYLSDVDEGGHTVFPLSTTHAGYTGEQIVHPGTVKTPGYIADKDARWACNASSSALRSGTRRGSAVLFYSQTPEGALDPYSLHGGCPVIAGVKYSANVWIWNRPKPSKDRAKDAAERPAPDHRGIQLTFRNTRAGDVHLFWDDGTDAMVFQGEIAAGEEQPMTTYHGHSFVMRDAVSNATLQRFTARDDVHKGVSHVELIN